MICNTCHKDLPEDSFCKEKSGDPCKKCKICRSKRVIQVNKWRSSERLIKKVGGKEAMKNRKFKRHYVCKVKTCINNTCSHHRSNTRKFIRDIDPFYWPDIRYGDFNNCKIYIPMKRY